MVTSGPLDFALELAVVGEILQIEKGCGDAEVRAIIGTFSAEPNGP